MGFVGEKNISEYSLVHSLYKTIKFSSITFSKMKKKIIVWILSLHRILTKGRFIKNVRFLLQSLEIPTYLCPIGYVLSTYVQFSLTYLLTPKSDILYELSQISQSDENTQSSICKQPFKSKKTSKNADLVILGLMNQNRQFIALWVSLGGPHLAWANFKIKIE